MLGNIGIFTEGCNVYLFLFIYGKFQKTHIQCNEEEEESYVLGEFIWHSGIRKQHLGKKNVLIIKIT